MLFREQGNNVWVLDVLWGSVCGSMDKVLHCWLLLSAESREVIVGGVRAQFSWFGDLLYQHCTIHCIQLNYFDFFSTEFQGFGGFWGLGNDWLIRKMLFEVFFIMNWSFWWILSTGEGNWIILRVSYVVLEHYNSILSIWNWYVTL